MKKNTKQAQTTTKPLNVFKLKAGELKMIHGGEGQVVPSPPPPGGGGMMP